MKRIAALIACLCLLLAFCACEQKNDATDITSSKPLLPKPTETESEESVVTDEEYFLEEEGTIRVGSYNIANGSKVHYNLRLIADDILAKKLDVVGIQEVDRLAKRSGYIDTMQLLSELTGYEHYHYVQTIEIPGDVETYGHEGQYGIGILSKYPILQKSRYEVDSTDTETRAVAYAKIDFNGKKINFFNTHLSYETEEVRTRQITHVANIVKDFKDCILVGDFNVMSFAELDPISTLTPANSPQNTVITHRADDWFQSIDNILYSKEFSLKTVNSLTYPIHSDHYMLYAKLQFE